MAFNIDSDNLDSVSPAQQAVDNSILINATTRDEEHEIFIFKLQSLIANGTNTFREWDSTIDKTSDVLTMALEGLGLRFSRAKTVLASLVFGPLPEGPHTASMHYNTDLGGYSKPDDPRTLALKVQNMPHNEDARSLVMHDLAYACMYPIAVTLKGMLLNIQQVLISAINAANHPSYIVDMKYFRKLDVAGLNSIDTVEKLEIAEDKLYNCILRVRDAVQNVHTALHSLHKKFDDFKKAAPMLKEEVIVELKFLLQELRTQFMSGISLLPLPADNPDLVISAQHYYNETMKIAINEFKRMEALIWDELNPMRYTETSATTLGPQQPTSSQSDTEASKSGSEPQRPNIGVSLVKFISLVEKHWPEAQRQIQALLAGAPKGAKGPTHVKLDLMLDLNGIQLSALADLVLRKAHSTDTSLPYNM